MHVAGALVLAAGLLAVSMVSIGCSRGAMAPAPTVTSKAPAVVLPNYRLSAHGQPGKTIEIEDAPHGKLVYRLTTRSIVYQTNLGRGTASDNKLVFYKGRAPRLMVSAPTADLNLRTYDVSLSGGINARNNEGASLRADEVAYDGKSQQLAASGHVVATDPNGTVIAGDHALADLDLHQIRIFGNIGVTGIRH